MKQLTWNVGPCRFSLHVGLARLNIVISSLPEATNFVVVNGVDLCTLKAEEFVARLSCSSAVHIYSRASSKNVLLKVSRHCVFPYRGLSALLDPALIDPALSVFTRSVSV